MGTLITIVILVVFGAVVGIFIAGANPEFAAKWNAWRREVLGL